MSDASPTPDRYRALFQAIDAGVCVIEVKFDADDRPLDYRFVEVNPAFEALTGLKDAAGKWMRELAPDHEQHWFDLYGRVALTGEAARFENLAAALGRWYDVHAYRIGDPAERQVAILFSDITERPARERGPLPHHGRHRPRAGVGDHSLRAGRVRQRRLRRADRQAARGAAR